MVPTQPLDHPTRPRRRHRRHCSSVSPPAYSSNAAPYLKATYALRPMRSRTLKLPPDHSVTRPRMALVSALPLAAALVRHHYTSLHV